MRSKGTNEHYYKLFKQPSSWWSSCNMYNPHNNMGIIQTIRVKKLSQEISNLKTSKKTDTDQRQVKTHDRSTYVEQANDITINHGSD